MATSHYLKDPWLKRPSLDRLQEINKHPFYQTIQNALKEHTSNQKEVTKVVHWFRDKDLRVQDNKALYYAFQKAHETKKPLIAVYVYTPDSLLEHGISKARLDFMIETIKGLQQELDALNIPLVVLQANHISQTNSVLLPFLKKHGISHLYANYEYEVNELKRDIKLVEKIGSNVNCNYYHDQSIFEPGSLTNQQNKPIQIFTPYHKVWVKKIKEASELLKVLPSPSKQASTVRKELSDLFHSPTLKVPDAKKFQSKKEQAQLRKKWPSGYSAAIKKLDYFIKHHLKDYARTRNQPALASTSEMSPYLATGAISVRTILEKMAKCNQGSYDFSQIKSTEGIFAWVREIVFREFYRDRLALKPHISMNFPENPKFASVKWEEDEAGWEKWCAGQTGVPWIDAGMRQLKNEAYMHNRLRMNVAFYLYSVFLIDYRKGERYFSEMLVDYDLANNAQGWSPSYTLFNPILQAEKNDPEGEYIRKWVPELKDVKGKAIFDPYGRLSQEEFEKLGYPKPHVDWKETKNRSRVRFKQAMRKESKSLES